MRRPIAGQLRVSYTTPQKQFFSPPFVCVYVCVCDSSFRQLFYVTSAKKKKKKDVTQIHSYIQICTLASNVLLHWQAVLRGIALRCPIFSQFRSLKPPSESPPSTSQCQQHQNRFAPAPSTAAVFACEANTHTKKKKRKMPARVASGGLFGVLFITVAAVIYYGSTWLIEKYHSQKAKEDAMYYKLPPAREGEDAAFARALAEDQLDAQDEQGHGDSSSSRFHGRRGKCVCCHDLLSRYAFVHCGHICICEPCLVKLGHNCEAKRGAPFEGPCRLPCPMCRQEGFIIKTYT